MRLRHDLRRSVSVSGAQLLLWATQDSRKQVIRSIKCHVLVVLE